MKSMKKGFYASDSIIDINKKDELLRYRAAAFSDPTSTILNHLHT